MFSWTKNVKIIYLTYFSFSFLYSMVGSNTHKQKKRASWLYSSSAVTMTTVKRLLLKGKRDDVSRLND
jgi:hypothetical protein